MKRLASLLLFACAVASSAQTNRYPHINVVTSNPNGGACSPANNLEQYNGDVYTCDPNSLTWRVSAYNGVTTDGASGIAVAGSISSQGAKVCATANGVCIPNQWQRLGVVVAPIAGDPVDSGAGHIQEASVVVSSSPEILTGYSKVKKFSFTNGWQPLTSGGSGMNICFGEAADDVSQPTRFPNCIFNHGRSYMAIDPTNGKYMLAAVNMSNAKLDIYENTTVSLLSQMGSPTYSNALACGSNGQEVAGSLGAAVPIWDATHSLWRVIYACQYTGASGSYSGWLATGAALNSLTKFSATPVIGFGSSAAITNCSDCALSQMFYSNGALIGYADGGPTGIVPTPFLYRFVDPTGVGNAWAADANPFLQAKTALEGTNFTNGQLGQPYLAPTLDGTGTTLYYTAYLNGCPNLSVCSYPTYVMAATIPQPLTTAIQQVTADALPLARTFQVNGVAASCGSVCNFVGPGVIDLGNGSISFSSPVTPATGSFVQGAANTSGNTTSLAVTTSATAAGNLIVACAKWYNAPTTFSISDGTSTLASTGIVTVIGSPDILYSQCNYLLSANAGKTTFTGTWGATAGSPTMWVAEYHQSAGAWHLLANTAANSLNVTGTASSSGSFSPNGTVAVAIMDTNINADITSTTSSPLLFGSTPTEFAFSPVATYDHKYYLLNKTVATGSGSVTYGTPTYWINSVLTFAAY